MNTTSIPAAGDAPATGTARVRDTSWLWVAIAAWIMGLAAVWWTLANYEFGWEKTDAGVVERWPAAARLTMSTDRPNLLFFMHPKCPCTRASLAELEKLWLLTASDSKLSPQLTVIVTVPWGANDDWYETETLNKASNLRGVKLIIDRNGEEARRFGVATSGTVMWFDTHGNRLYSGGITASRGHEGDSLGGNTVAGLLRGSSRPAAGLPAFGCRLCLPETAGVTAQPATQRIKIESIGGETL